MDMPRRSLQVNMRTVLVIVASLAAVCFLARTFWDLDPVHRGGRLLRDSRPSERIRGLLAIAEAPGVNDDSAQAIAALPAVLGAIRDEDARVRAEAIRCSAVLVGSIMTHQSRPPSANAQSDVTSGVSALAQAIGDDDPAVRAEAATALGMLDPASAHVAPQLVMALKDPDPAVRCSIVIALSRMRSLASDSDPFQAVESHQDPDPSVRIAILEALPAVYRARQEWRIAQERAGKLPASIRLRSASPAPRERLLAGLKDSDRRVRAKSVILLRPLALLRAGSEPYPGELSRLTQAQKDEALPVFLEALSDDSKEVRLAAAECSFAIVDYGQEGPIEGLAKSLAQEKDSSVSLTIARALARIGDDRAITVLCNALDDPHNRTRLIPVVAKAAHGGAQSQTVIQRLTPLLKDESPAVRVDALRAIASFRWRAVDLIPQIDRLSSTDADPAVRETAREARSAIKRPLNLMGGAR